MKNFFVLALSTVVIITAGLSACESEPINSETEPSNLADTDTSTPDENAADNSDDPTGEKPQSVSHAPKKEGTQEERTTAENADIPVMADGVLSRQSIMIVLNMPAQPMPDYVKRDPNMTPEERLARWKDKPISDNSTGRDHLKEVEKKLKDLAARIKSETGQDSVPIVTAETLIVNLSETEIAAIKDWPEVKEVLANAGVRQR